MSRLTSSRKSITPPGGQIVAKPQGTKRLKPAFFAAVATFICASSDRAEMALMNMSNPESKGAKSPSGDDTSAMRILTPLFTRPFTLGLSADEGRIKTVISCFLL
jgi:hypothetical protein